MNSFTDIFQRHFIYPLPPFQSPPPHVLNTCGKPWDICPLGGWEILLGGGFLCRGSNIWWESEEEWLWPFKSFLKLKNKLQWNFAGRIFFTRQWKFKVRDQVIEYNRIFFFKNFVENDAESFTIPVFVFWKSFMWIKCNQSAAWFHYIYFNSPQVVI